MLVFDVSRITVLHNDVIGENEEAAIVERDSEQNDNQYHDEGSGNSQQNSSRCKSLLAT